MLPKFYQGRQIVCGLVNFRYDHESLFKFKDHSVRNLVNLLNRPNGLTKTPSITKALCLLSTVCMGLMSQGHASQLAFGAQQGYFVAGHGGAAFPGDQANHLNTGYSAGVEYGYAFDNFRSFLETDFTQHPYKAPSQADYQLVDLMINLGYDFNYTGHWIPFVGGGFGYMRLWSSQCQSDPSACADLIDSSRVSYQGFAGLGWRGKHVRLELRYRFVSLINNTNNFYDNIPEIVLSYYFWRGNQMD